MAKAKVYVYLKNGILDPQGKATHHILTTMNFDQVKEVRVGKYITLDFSDQLSRQEIEQQTEQICRKLLANPIIEDYNFDIELNSK